VKRACYASDRTGRVVLDTLYGQCVKKGVRFYSECVLIDLSFIDDQAGGAILFEWATGEIHEVRQTDLKDAGIAVNSLLYR